MALAAMLRGLRAALAALREHPIRADLEVAAGAEFILKAVQSRGLRCARPLPLILADDAREGRQVNVLAPPRARLVDRGRA